MKTAFAIIKHWGAWYEDLTDVIAVYEDAEHAKAEAARLEREQPDRSEFWQPEDGPERYTVEQVPFHKRMSAT